MKLILGRIPIMFVGAFFASRPRARPVGALGIFACPTLERFPPPFYLIRHEPMVEELILFNHWFMPYKVERGRKSLQCGTSKYA